MLTPKTPAEIAEDLYNRLKKDLEQIGVKVTRTGFFGYIANLVALAEYDLINYYNYLFREMFPETANDLNHLLFHASRYKVPINFAIPSFLEGNLVITDPNKLLQPVPPNTNRAQVLLIDGFKDYNIPDYVGKSFDNFTVKVNGVKYISQAEYWIDADLSNNIYYCRIIDKEGNVQLYPLATPPWYLPITDIYQFEPIIKKIRLPIYAKGTYYDLDITDVDYTEVYEVIVFALINNQWKRLEIKFSEATAGEEEPVVFFQVLPKGFRLRFGSGYRGIYLSNTDVVICIKKTLADRVEATTFEGTINKPVSILYTGPNTSTTVIRQLNDIFHIECRNTEGKRSFTYDSLRDSILKYLVTRDNIVTRADYQNYFSSLLDIYEVVHRKITVYDNTITVFITLRDRYQNIVHTDTKTYPESSFNPSSDTVVVHPTYTYTIGESQYEFISPFVYVKDDILHTYKAYLLFDELEIPFQRVIIQDSTIPQPVITWKLIYDETNYLSKFLITSQTDISKYNFKISLDGQNPVDLKLETTSDAIYTYSDPSKKSVLFGENRNVSLIVEYLGDPIQISGTCYVTTDDSGNPVKVIGTNTNFTNELSPSDYFYLEIDGITKRVRVSQVISSTELILAEPYEGTLNTSSNAFIQKTQSTVMTVNSFFTQCYDYSSYLVISTYEKDTVTYVVDVPLVEKSSWDTERDYILKQLLALRNQNVSDKICLTDTLKYGFLNTFYVPSGYTVHLFKQGYTSDIMFPLNISIAIIYDSTYVGKENIDLVRLKSDFLIKIAKMLKERYTGTRASFYDSDMVAYIKNMYPWIKDVKVTVTDMLGNVFDDGFELVEPETVMREVWEATTDKLAVLNYIPVSIYWDVNNIKLDFISG